MAGSKKQPADATAILFQAPPAPPAAPARAPREPRENRGDVKDDNPQRDNDIFDEPPSKNAKNAGRKRKKDYKEKPQQEGEDSIQPSPVDDSDDGATDGAANRKRRRGRGKRGNTPADASADAETAGNDSSEDADGDDEDGGTHRRRRRQRTDNTRSDAVTAVEGSTRLEAKRQRRRESRDSGRRRPVITEAEFLARRENVKRDMVVRENDGKIQIAVLEDGVLVEHYVSNNAQVSSVGNVYLGRVQNVLPSMEAAFIDIGKGRNAVLYAGEVNWDAAGMEGKPRQIEMVLQQGDAVLAQVTKDPIGHKGARLTSQITLAGRFLVLVPGGEMTGISRKLPDIERKRLKKLLKQVVPEDTGVIVRTAAEGASEKDLRNDVERLVKQWKSIEKKQKTAKAPSLLSGEPDLAIRVVRDIFNEDFTSLTISGDEAWESISTYIKDVAPDLVERMEKWTGVEDVFTSNRIDEQLAKGMDRKVWLPSGGSLVIDRTEAMTVIDVNTGRFTGEGGSLEETVTKNNLEAAEEIVRQMRLRDIGGIIVVDFIDMVLESNRDLVLRRLVECLGRDRTRHQVAEVTSLGLVQMTRKRVGQGLVEAFSEACEVCDGRGFIVHKEPVDTVYNAFEAGDDVAEVKDPGARRRRKTKAATPKAEAQVLPEATDEVKATLASIAAAAAHRHDGDEDGDDIEAADEPPAIVAEEEDTAAAPARRRGHRRAVG